MLICLGHVLFPARPYCYLKAATYCAVLLHACFHHLRATEKYRPPCYFLNIKGPHTYIFSIGSAFRVALHILTGQSSVSLYSKIHVKMSQNHKNGFCGPQILCHSALKTHRVRATSHRHPYMQFAMHHWFPRLRYADCEMGPYHRFLIFGNIYKNTEKHKEMPSPELKIYKLLSPGPHRVRASSLSALIKLSFVFPLYTKYIEKDLCADLKFYEESLIMISGPTHRVAYMPCIKAPPLLKAPIEISPRTQKFMRNNL